LVLVGVFYPGYRGLPLTAQTSEYAQFPLGAKTAGEVHTPYQVRPYYSWLERKGHPSEKN
jgi:hypothetical protein